MLDVELIASRIREADEYRITCVGLDSEDWLIHGYGSRNAEVDIRALIAEVERLRAAFIHAEQSGFVAGALQKNPIIQCKYCGKFNR